MGAVRRQVPPGGARRVWQPATITAVRRESRTASTFVLQLDPATPRHVPGQHYDVRLTAPDGSQAQRSYSIASAPAAGGVLELTIDRIAGGDVSPYVHDVLAPGDTIEVRGPFGGWFIWKGDTPALLIGGGSGVVPLMSMLRYWRQLRAASNGPERGEQASVVPLHLVVSARSPADLLYAGEYADETTRVFTREVPPGFARPPSRLDAATLRPVVDAALAVPGTVAYVCGSSGFAEHASQLLVELGVAVPAIRVERFGPG